jgi:hypothetical protein
VNKKVGALTTPLGTSGKNAYLAGWLYCSQYLIYPLTGLVFMACTPSVEWLPCPSIAKKHDIILLKSKEEGAEFFFDLFKEEEFFFD